MKLRGRKSHPSQYYPLVVLFSVLTPLLLSAALPDSHLAKERGLMTEDAMCAA